MDFVVVEFKKMSDSVELPTYAHGPTEDAGMDIRAAHNAVIAPGRIQVISTGVMMALPAGYEGQVRSRSGLASKGIVVMNAPGTIDPGYRGEIKVILGNMSSEEFVVTAGDRIAQIVVARYSAVVQSVADDLSSTSRGEGGLGSTGK